MRKYTLSDGVATWWEKHLFSPKKLNKYDKVLIPSFYFKSGAHGVLGKGVCPQ